MTRAGDFSRSAAPDDRKNGGTGRTSGDKDVVRRQRRTLDLGPNHSEVEDRVRRTQEKNLTMKRTLRFLLLTALAIVVVIAIVRGAKFFSALYVHSKLDENEGKVSTLARVIELEKPQDASRQSLLFALRRDGIKDPESTLKDAWHHPLRVSVWRDQAQQYHYQVMSLGRDGRIGPCALGQAGCDHNLDGDWIIVDGHVVTAAASR